MTEPGIIWLASYPKCGNTWLRFLLYAAIHAPPSTSIEVTRKIPDLHRPLPVDPPEPGRPMLVKTHFMLTERHPRLGQTLRAIHVVRDPRDAALSALNYRRLAADAKANLDEAAYLRAFIRAGGDPAWQRQGFGTWATHAASWRDTDRFPVLALRYEDVKADPHAALASMLGFIGCETTPERVDAAVRAASFDAMRAMEIREKQKASADPRAERLFIGDARAARKGVFFMNKGASGQSLDRVAPGLDAMMDAAFAADLARYGYTRD